jgi:hypothetical protein
MANLTKALFLLSAVAFLTIGCQNDNNPLDTPGARLPAPAGAASFIIPPGATLDSATFFINVVQPNAQTINVHRVTQSWEESSVTWNSFGGSYDPTVIGSFVADAAEWRSVDITDLVKKWMDGTYENFGILLDQADPGVYPRAIFLSSDNEINRPYLRICYTLNEQTTCDQDQPIADAYIWELMPDINYGTALLLFTGWQSSTDLESQSLLKFDMETKPELAVLGDTVWYDDNMDGLQDDGEMGIENVTVNLYDCEDVFLQTTTTDANGYYVFMNLMPGDYYVEFILPSGYVFSPQDQGMDDEKDSDADPATGKTECLNLEAGENDFSWDAGMYKPATQGCTHSKGYWMNHAGFGPQKNLVSPYLPIWLGNDGGSASIAVTDSAIAYEILSQKLDSRSNGIVKLYAQLLAAKLCIADGADDMDVAEIISSADDFLSDYGYNDWYNLDKSDQKSVLYWKDMLDQYNNGLIGPGHCDKMVSYSTMMTGRTDLDSDQ